MRPANHPHRLHRTLRRAALDYARHGWAVLPGACLTGARFRCERPGCPTVGCHPALDGGAEAASCEVEQVLAWWSRRAFSVLLPTGRTFDVIEAPGQLAAPAARILAEDGLAGPIAVTSDSRWMFFVAVGDRLRPDLYHLRGPIQHAAGSWVPAPPTRYPDGRVRWLAPPGAGDWQVPGSDPVQRALLDAVPLRR